MSSTSREVGGDALGVVAFVDEVQLERDVLAHLLRDEAVVHRAVELVEHADEERHVRQVDVDDLARCRGTAPSRRRRGRRAGRARCTCASDADATGVSSNSENISSSGRPSSRSTCARDVLERLRRHLVVQRRERLDVGVGQDVRARAEELPGLDQQALVLDRRLVELVGAPAVVLLAARLAPLRALALLAEADAACSPRRRARASGRRS